MSFARRKVILKTGLTENEYDAARRLSLFPLPPGKLNYGTISTGSPSLDQSQ
jgi:hypothetical protein